MEEYWIFEINVAKCRHCDQEYTNYIDKYDLKVHITQHNIYTFEDNWLCQYFELQNNMMKCKFCPKKYKIQILPKLKKHSNQHESMIDTGNRHKREDYWWIKYCTLKNNKAQCRFCDKFYYITIYKYRYENHVAIGHSEIYNKIDKKENWIWQYFVFGSDMAMCRICKRYFIVTLDSNSMRRHLNAKHKDKMKENQDEESGQGIHSNAQTNMNSIFASLINNLIQIHNKKHLKSAE